MDWKRFIVACVYRGGSDPWPIKAPLPAVLFSFHAATAYAAVSLFGESPPSAALVGSSLGMYTLLTFGITGGHHRYFSHRSYKTSRAFQFALASVGCLAWQRGPIWWSSHHNFHHQHSDTEVDPHSPVTGSFLWSHMGWYWASSQYDAPLEAYSRTWRKYPELAVLDKLHMLPGIAMFSSLYAAGGAELALWAYVVPVVGCWNGIFAIGSICHGELGGGTRPFARTGAADQSTNVPWVALLTLGDGWHNNHHQFRWSARHGLRWWELDVTFGILTALERLGLVWDLAVPTPAQIARAEGATAATSGAADAPAAAPAAAPASAPASAIAAGPAKPDTSAATAEEVAPSLFRPIGTREEPAPPDRQMGLARFVIAQGQREASGWPLGAGPPLLVTTSVVMHSAAAWALWDASALGGGACAPGALEASLCAASFGVRMFGITGGYHRYFAHGAYQTSRPAQFALGVLGAAAWQKGPLWWASHHTEHHLHSDLPSDPHSPVSGSLLWSHMGWFWACREFDAHPDAFLQGKGRVAKFGAYPELVALDRFHHGPGIALASLAYAAGGMPGLLWGFVVPTVGLWHSTFAVNSACHRWGSRRFATTDDSRNNLWVALAAFGEGNHNNHHAFPWSAKHGLTWCEPDLTYAILRGLERLGVVWNLKVPTPEQLARAEARPRLTVNKVAAAAEA